MKITSKDMNEFEGDLSLIEIDINDNMRYYDGTDITSGRSGAKPVNGLVMFELAKKARERADLLIDAAAAMDLRILCALDRAEAL
jgi:hypothetical protein